MERWGKWLSARYPHAETHSQMYAENNPWADGDADPRSHPDSHACSHRYADADRDGHAACDADAAFASDAHDEHRSRRLIGALRRKTGVHGTAHHHGRPRRRRTHA